MGCNQRTARRRDTQRADADGRSKSETRRGGVRPRGRLPVLADTRSPGHWHALDPADGAVPGPDTGRSPRPPDPAASRDHALQTTRTSMERRQRESTARGQERALRVAPLEAPLTTARAAKQVSPMALASLSSRTRSGRRRKARPSPCDDRIGRRSGGRLEWAAGAVAVLPLTPSPDRSELQAGGGEHHRRPCDKGASSRRAQDRAPMAARSASTKASGRSPIAKWPQSSIGYRGQPNRALTSSAIRKRVIRSFLLQISAT
jgi:hypothetical protein